MLLRRVGLFAALLSVSAAKASVVVNPVAAPVAPGISVAISKLGQAPILDPTWNNAARIQQLKPVGDGSGRMFLNDTSGRIEVMGAAGGTPSVWFDVQAAVPSFSIGNPSQMGLMSFAFHPNFNGDPAKPGYGTFYVLETETASSGTATLVANGPVDHHNVIREFTVADPNAATATITASREVLRMTQPYTDHGPGMLSFNTVAKPGDVDYGNLYIGIGDGGGWADDNDNAQNLHSPAGKILRINPLDPDGAGPAAYSIPTGPKGNPFVGDDAKLPEIWAYGLRNPQSFSWDPVTGKMVIIDIGMSQLEEVNLGQAGADYGWPAREGTYARTDRWGTGVYDDPNIGGFVDPILQYDHEEVLRSGRYGNVAISSAFVYRGSIPELQGMVIMSDLVSGRVFYAPFDNGQGSIDMHELFFTIDGQPVNFEFEQIGGRSDLRLAQLENGEIGFLFKTSGDIWQLDAAVPEPASWALMILGFGLIGGGARRRRLAAA